MTNDELDRLDALAAAATPGPWVFVAPKPRSVGTLGFVALGDQRGPFLSDEQCAMAAADAQFIAAARDAVPALVAEVRRLRALVEGVVTAYDSYDKPGEDWERNSSDAVRYARATLDGAA